MLVKCLPYSLMIFYMFYSHLNMCSHASEEPGSFFAEAIYYNPDKSARIIKHGSTVPFCAPVRLTVTSNGSSISGLKIVCSSKQLPFIISGQSKEDKREGQSLKSYTVTSTHTYMLVESTKAVKCSLKNQKTEVNNLEFALAISDDEDSPTFTATAQYREPNDMIHETPHGSSVPYCAPMELTVTSSGYSIPNLQTICRSKTWPFIIATTKQFTETSEAVGGHLTYEMRNVHAYRLVNSTSQIICTLVDNEQELARLEFGLIITGSEGYSEGTPSASSQTALVIPNTNTMLEDNNYSKVSRPYYAVVLGSFLITLILL